MATAVPAPPPSPTDRIPARLGLGCVTFGREIDREASFRLMDYAVAHGILCFDTAAAYAQGASERIVGEWLAANEARSAVQLGTKLLPPYSAATLAAAVSQSLERLRTDTIDVLYLHRWDDSVLAPDFLSSLAALVASGWVRRLGASNFTLEQLRRSLLAQADASCPPFRVLQNVHNVALRAIDTGTADFCAAHAIALVTYSPLGAGFLTGKYNDGVPPGTRFDAIPGHQSLYFTPESRRRLAALQALARSEQSSIVDLALAWALHPPFTATVLVGGRTPAHLDQALRAASLGRPELFKTLDSA